MSHTHDRTASGLCIGCVSDQVRNEERNRICALIESLQDIYGGTSDAHARTLGRLMERIRCGQHRKPEDR